MKPGPLFLLQLGLAAAGLLIYHLAGPAPAGAPADESTPAPGPPESVADGDPVVAERTRELDAFERRLAALETGIYQVRRDLDDVRIVTSSGASREELLSDERMAVLEAKVDVVDARRLVERRTHNLLIGVRELKQGLKHVEERMVVEILQRSYAEGGAFGKKLRDEKIHDPQKNLEGYDKIRKRYHEELRGLLTKEQADAIIARFLPLR